MTEPTVNPVVPKTVEELTEIIKNIPGPTNADKIAIRGTHAISEREISNWHLINAAKADLANYCTWLLEVCPEAETLIFVEHTDGNVYLSKVRDIDGVNVTSSQMAGEFMEFQGTPGFGNFAGQEISVKEFSNWLPLQSFFGA